MMIIRLLTYDFWWQNLKVYLTYINLNELECFLQKIIIYFDFFFVSWIIYKNLYYHGGNNNSRYLKQSFLFQIKIEKVRIYFWIELNLKRYINYQNIPVKFDYSFGLMIFFMSFFRKLLIDLEFLWSPNKYQNTVYSISNSLMKYKKNKIKN